MAVESGFHVLHSEVRPFRYLFDGKMKLEATLMPVTPYIPRIPEERRKQFMEEMVDEWRKVAPMEMGQNGEFVDVLDAEMLIVVLQKPAD